MHGGPGLDPHRPVEPGHPPLVLVLDVAVGAVADDGHGDPVPALLHLVGDVVFGGQAAVGAVADEGPVDPDGVHTLGPAEVKHHPLPTFEPGGGNLEGPPVDTGGVALRQGRGWTVEGHLDVGVVGGVDRGELHGPVAGDLDLGGSPAAPAAEGLGGYRIGMVEQLERPGAVQPLASEAG